MSEMEEIKAETIYQDINNNHSGHSILNIIHFNDVYNIESGSIEPKAGAARFLTVINHLKSNKFSQSIVLFSGDAFSPSEISALTKGSQMVTCLNKFGIDSACIGNHDFDFGVERLTVLIHETNFPWLISNVVDKQTKKPLANAKVKHVLEIDNFRVGLIGLVEHEWIETLSALDNDDIIYECFVGAGNRLVHELRTIDKVDIVIAMTHMRLPNDIKLANEVHDLDLILGGHDHNYVCKMVNNKWIIKSGCDFKNLSTIELSKKDKSVKKIDKYVIDSSIPEHNDLKFIVDEYMKTMTNNEIYTDILAKLDADLDGRFIVCRTQESNLANLICDILLDSIKAAECCIVNSGTFRSDCINPAGSNLTYGDLKKIIPGNNELVVIKCSGKTIHDALENGVSTYPKLEGRFPQVSGLSFEFDPKREPFNRVDPKSISVKGKQLELEKDYSVLVKKFIKDGKDGYKCLTPCHVLIDFYQFPLYFTIIENYFRKNLALNNDFHIAPKTENRIVIL